MSLAQPLGPSARQVWGVLALLAAAVLAGLIFAIWPEWLQDILISKRAFISAILNGITLAGLYFLVASGFTLIFGLMRNVNLTHGSLYLLGAYIGYEVAGRTGFWLLGVAAGFVAVGLVGLVYFPTYGIVLTFVIMVATLAIRAQGIMGGRT